MPEFEFLEEEEDGTYNARITNVVYGAHSQAVSYDAFYTFSSTSNTYKIIVTEITRTYIKYYPGGTYTADITANVNGKTISGTLEYP